MLWLCLLADSPRQGVFLPPWPVVRERGIDAPPLMYPPYAVSEEEAEVGSGNFGRGTRQQSSLNSALDNKYGKKDSKKKAGLFKGIGSMFRSALVNFALFIRYFVFISK